MLSHYADRPFIDFVFFRATMLLKALRKEKPPALEKKQAWNIQYFAQIFFGMHWYRATRSLHRDWAHFRTRVVWTAMITMHEHLLRLGEVVQPPVDTQTGKRRWIRASVSFWMGEN